MVWRFRGLGFGGAGDTLVYWNHSTGQQVWAAPGVQPTGTLYNAGDTSVDSLIVQAAFAAAGVGGVTMPAGMSVVNVAPDGDTSETAQGWGAAITATLIVLPSYYPATEQEAAAMDWRLVGWDHGEPGVAHGTKMFAMPGAVAGEQRQATYIAVVADNFTPGTRPIWYAPGWGPTSGGGTPTPIAAPTKPTTAAQADAAGWTRDMSIPVTIYPGQVGYRPPAGWPGGEFDWLVVDDPAWSPIPSSEADALEKEWIRSQTWKASDSTITYQNPWAPGSRQNPPGSQQTVAFAQVALGPKPIRYATADEPATYYEARDAGWRPITGELAAKAGLDYSWLSASVWQFGNVEAMFPPSDFSAVVVFPLSAPGPTTEQWTLTRDLLRMLESNRQNLATHLAWGATTGPSVLAAAAAASASALMLATWRAQAAAVGMDWEDVNKEALNVATAQAAAAASAAALANAPVAAAVSTRNALPGAISPDGSPDDAVAAAKAQLEFLAAPEHAQAWPLAQVDAVGLAGDVQAALDELTTALGEARVYVKPPPVVAVETGGGHPASDTAYWSYIGPPQLDRGDPPDLEAAIAAGWQHKDGDPSDWTKNLSFMMWRPDRGPRTIIYDNPAAISPPSEDAAKGFGWSLVDLDAGNRNALWQSADGELTSEWLQHDDRRFGFKTEAECIKAKWKKVHTDELVGGTGTGNMIYQAPSGGTAAVALVWVENPDGTHSLKQPATETEAIGLGWELIDLKPGNTSAGWSHRFLSTDPASQRYGATEHQWEATVWLPHKPGVNEYTQEAEVHPLGWRLTQISPDLKSGRYTAPSGGSISVRLTTPGKGMDTSGKGGPGSGKQLPLTFILAGMGAGFLAGKKSGKSLPLALAGAVGGWFLGKDGA